MSEIVLPEKGKVVKKGAYKTATLGDVRIADKTTKIGEEAFWCNGTITSVSIPASVEEIGSNAFSTCGNLANVEIAEGTALKTIPYNCFEETKIASIVIPEGVETIGSLAFWKCASLKSVVFPSTIKSIAETAFIGCSLLAPIVRDGRLFCIPVPSAKTAIPAGVKIIASRCFFSNDEIVEVKIPEGVEEIEESAFYGCDNLKKLTLPKSLKKIGETAFYGCAALEAVNVPAGIAIAADAFAGCDSLDAATKEAIASAIPQDNTKIREEQYKGDTSLTEFTVPQGVVEIGAHAFDGCVNLSRVEIPEGVTKLDYGIFEGCASLKEVVLPESCVELHGLCKVFKGCTSLERVVFKGKIDGLGGSFFAGCSALREVVFEKGVGVDSFNRHRWEMNVFEDCTSLVPVIPEGVTYIETAEVSFPDLAEVAKIAVDDIVINQDMPTVTVTDTATNTVLELDKDYTVEYSGDTTNAGTATVTITAKDGSTYIGSKSVKFAVLPREMKASITNRRKAGTNAKATLSGEWYLPKNATNIKAGIARLSTDDTNITKYDVYNNGVKKASALKTTSGKYSFSLTLNSTHANQNLYAVTYVTYEIDDVSYVSISDMDSSIVK